MGTLTTSSGNSTSYQAVFNAAYFASKPPAFQPLYAGFSGAQLGTQSEIGLADRQNLCAQLIAQGFTIDEEIEFFGWDPYTTMVIREAYGDTWVPAGLGNVASVTEQPAQYTGPVPAGAIKVSTLLSDYPAYPVPTSGTVTPPTPQATNPVGIRIIAQVPAAANYVGDVFRCAVANDGYALGQTWSGTAGAFSGTWTKQALEMGLMVVWVKTA